MTDSDASSALARVRGAKNPDGGVPSITGAKLVLFGVQLTLLGGFVPEWGILLFVGVLASALGLLVD